MSSSVSGAKSATTATTLTTDGKGGLKVGGEESSEGLQQPGEVVGATSSSSELAGEVVDATSAQRGHLDVSRHNLPLCRIVNQAAVKEALLAAAVDPELGGVALVGGHGTGKTVMARSLQQLLPPIAVVTGSWANADPTRPEEWEDGLRESVKEQGFDIRRPPITLCNPPFVQVPLGVTEDRLLGSVDVEASIDEGRSVFLPGLLAQCHRGVLYIDDANLLDDTMGSLLFASLADGSSTVEREGLSVRHACRPLLLASFNAEEGMLRRHLLDRIALIVSTDAPLSLEQRVAAADVANTYLDGRRATGGGDKGHVRGKGGMRLEDEKEEERVEREEEGSVEKGADEEREEDGVEADRLRVLFARQLLPRVTISQAQIAFLVDAAVQLECEGQRAELFAVRAAKALAALNGRSQVTQADLSRAAQLAVVPRATVSLDSEPASSTPQSSRPVPPPPSRRKEESNEEQQEEQEGEQQEESHKEQQEESHKEQQEESHKEQQEESHKEQQEESHKEQQEESHKEQQEESHKEQQEEQEAQPPAADEDQLVPASFVVAAEDTRLDAAALQMFQRAARTAGRAGRSKNKIFSEERGRYVKALLPKGKVVRLAVDATLRAAAPLQRLRRERAQRAGGRVRRIYVTKSDLRRKLLARRASSLVIFIVDASGSMALNRMGAAKGAALQLLAESYSKRDSVAVVPFHDLHADLLVPPSRAVALAHKR
ncbi:hypothetical protein CLOM_g16606 [Closterium sp. NIES-68]|nr:hypothetical protein CLOM_g16606 [Closterium sp. NIES-68]GJP78022.1 hypothetical protein CLOP_g8355 [Closterium sp. NIES-67]